MWERSKAAQTGIRLLSIGHSELELIPLYRPNRPTGRSEIQISTNWELITDENLSKSDQQFSLMDLSQQLSREIRSQWDKLVDSRPVSDQSLKDHGPLFRLLTICHRTTQIIWVEF